MSAMLLLIAALGVPVLLLMGVYIGQKAICRKWGTWYIVPGCFILLLVSLVCSYLWGGAGDFFGVEWGRNEFEDVIGFLLFPAMVMIMCLWKAIWWYCFLVGVALLIDALVATVVGMRMRKQEHEVAEWEAIQTENESNEEV